LGDEPGVGAQIDQAALDGYGLSVAKQVGQSSRTYPSRSRRLKQQGSAEVVIQVDEDGSVKDIVVSRSSGYRSLDNEAIERVRSVLPLPSAPPDLRGREYKIQIPISFKLSEPEPH
jgi:protein TonB